MYAAFPHSEYYQRIRLPLQHLPFSGMIHIVRHTRSALSADRDHSGSPRSLGASVSERAVLSDPAAVSGHLAICGAPTSAYPAITILSACGSVLNEAQSLHFRYGSRVALSTPSPIRYLLGPKTRFPVRRLHLLTGREFHPLEAPGLSWRAVVQVDVGQQRRCTAALGCTFFHSYPLPILQHAGIQPFLDEPHNASVRNSMLDELHQPFVGNLVEKAANVQIKHPAHFSRQQSGVERIQCLMLASLWPEPVGETEKVRFVNGV